MARTRNIEEEPALAAAVAAFWQHGYGVLGTRQLEAETGITRFTLQKSYGGKMALFGKALDAYLDQMESDLMPLMADGTLEGLARWFEMRGEGAILPDSAKWGCMMIAAINEFGATEPEVDARSSRFQQMLRRGFADALARIDQEGELNPELDQTSAVELLLAASIGLNVVIRGGGDCKAGAAVGSGIASIVRGWKAAITN